MDKHAFAVLERAESWWPQRKPGEGGKAITPNLLSCYITESQALGGTLLDKFWTQIGLCHPKLQENIEKLQRAPVPTSTDQSFVLLFEGIDQSTIDFESIFQMTLELFAHLGIAFMNLKGIVPEVDTSLISEVTCRGTEDLLKLAEEERWNRTVLQELTFRRDGRACKMTGWPFNIPSHYTRPTLTYLVPNNINPDTLDCIATFAGGNVRDVVQEHLNKVGNVISLEINAHTSHNDLWWGIEAQSVNGIVKYVHRIVDGSRTPGPGFIRLRDGDEIQFGRGPEGHQLGHGPLPLLCNLRLAIARVLWMSDSVDVVAELGGEAELGGVAEAKSVSKLTDDADHSGVVSQTYDGLKDFYNTFMEQFSSLRLPTLGW